MLCYLQVPKNSDTCFVNLSKVKASKPVEIWRWGASVASVWWGNCVCEAVVVQYWSLSAWTERASLGSCKWVTHCIPLVCGWWSAYAAVNSVLPQLHNSFLPLCFRCKSSMIRNTSRSCSALPASPMTTPTPRTPTRRVLWCAMPPGTLLDTELHHHSVPSVIALDIFQTGMKVNKGDKSGPQKPVRYTTVLYIKFKCLIRRQKLLVV